MTTTSSASPCLESVNAARAVHVTGMGYARPTAIDKRPVTGPVPVGRLGLAGDEVGDPRYHGGADQAVYAFAREDLDAWSRRLGDELGDELGDRLDHRLPSGCFGENLTTVGIDVNEALVGERWRVGTALLEVCSVRIPCNVFKRWVAFTGRDASGWVKRFTAEARPGPYLRVVEQGVVQAGDPVVVEFRPDHGVTVSTMFRALTTERALLPLLLEVAAVPAGIRRDAEEYVARHGAPVSAGGSVSARASAPGHQASGQPVLQEA